MKKLIELDAALDALREVIVPEKDIGFGDESTDGYNDGLDMAITVLSSQLAVDAVPVVRCKDCKFYYQMTAETGICELACRHLGNDGFCSEGERYESVES